MIRSLLALFIAMVGSLEAGLSLATEAFRNGSEIRVEAPIGVLPVTGFLPIRVELRNEGEKEMNWDLTWKSSYYEDDFRSNPINGEIISKFTVSCPPREMRSIDLLIPIHNRPSYYGRERIVTVTGSSSDLNSTISGSMSNEGLDFVFGVSQDLLGSLNDKIGQNWTGRESSRFGYFSSVIGGEIDPNQLPKDWRAYAGYDALALSREDYLKQDQGVKLALDQWVRSGGNLILLAESDTFPARFGQGTKSNGLGQQSFLNCGPGFEEFNGSRFVSLVRKTNRALIKKIETEYSNEDWLVGRALGKRTLQKSLLLVALIVFAVVVGPVNLFFWAGRNRRHRLFFTTPFISLVASVLLVGFIILRDGFGGDGARAVLIEVGGPDDKTAVILQEQFSRNGVLFSSDFVIDDQTVFVPVKAAPSDLNRFDSSSGNGNYNLEVSKTKEGWDVSGDLFQSRSENAQVLRSVVPSRERLELIPGTSGGPQMTSSFAYPLAKVFYTDKEGDIWMASSLEPGETVTMTPFQSSTLAAELFIPVSRFGESNQVAIKQLLERKNSFAAIAEGVPGIESHPAIDWQDSPTLITGLLSQ